MSQGTNRPKLSEEREIMLARVREVELTETRAREVQPSYKYNEESNGTRGIVSLAPTGARRAATNSVARIAEARLPTEFGEFRIVGYRAPSSGEEFVALVMGQPRPGRASLVRIHSQCLTGDVFGSVKCDCGRQLRAAMRLIASAGQGAIVYQQQEGRGIGIINKIRAYALQDAGADTVEANELLGLEVDPRRYEQCAEIFSDLGLRRVRVMSNNPAKIRALEEHGLEVTERVQLEVEPHDGFAHYLKTKKERMGHLINVA